MTVSVDKSSPTRLSCSTLLVSRAVHFLSERRAKVRIFASVEEAFTSENWLVRIYAVKKEDDIGRGLPDATAFNSGTKLRKGRSAVNTAKTKV
jgi:hypothetical protein